MCFLLGIVYGQAVYNSHRLRNDALEASRLQLAATHERDEYKSILGSLPEGVIIARSKSRREQREEQDRLYQHMDD